MNYETLLNIPYKTWKIFIILTILLVICGIIFINVTVYDVYNTYAYYQNGTLNLNVPITYSDTILNGEYYKINDKKKELEVLYVSDIKIDSNAMVNYQEIIISSSSDYPNNLVVKISIYYNKEKIWNKLKKLL